MSYTPADPWFGNELKAAGWQEVTPFVEFQKNRRRIIFDTSNWMELYDDTNRRISDVPVPVRGHEQETLKLIERLFAEETSSTK
jgi:hypothetical protein